RAARRGPRAARPSVHRALLRDRRRRDVHRRDERAHGGSGRDGRRSAGAAARVRECRDGAPAADRRAPQPALRDPLARRQSLASASVHVSAEAARRFLVARQFLAPARSVEGGREGVLEVIRKLGSIQFDPIAVAGRSHDLALHARVAGYEPAWSERLYERREIFEAYNKGLSFVRVSDFPFFRAPRSARAKRTIEENGDVAARVLERIRADGPLSALDFEREQGPTTDWFGLPTNTVRAVLEAYALLGVLGLARRDGNRRYYDLLERLLPRRVLAEGVPLTEKLRHKMLSRFRAHGLLGPSPGADILSGLGPAKPDPRFP